MMSVNQQDPKYIYVGELAETPLPEMLATIHRHRVPGVLEAEVEDGVKRVFIFNGDIIFATSTNRAESLGDMLLAAGRITHEQYRASSLLLLENPTKRHGRILMEMGFLTEAELRVVVLEQVQRIVWGLFGVNEGKVTFTLGEFRTDETYKLRIPTPRAILHGCKTMPDARRLVSRLGSKNTVLLRQEVPEHLQGFELEAQEDQLLSLVDGRKTLYQLFVQGPFAPGLNARVLYAFYCLGLVKKGVEQSGAVKVQVSPGM